MVRSLNDVIHGVRAALTKRVQVMNLEIRFTEL
jgi:hypothetical protein